MDDNFIKEINLKENQNLKLSLAWEANVIKKIKYRPGPPVHSIEYNVPLNFEEKPKNHVFPPIKILYGKMETTIQNFDLYLLDENNNVVQKSNSLSFQVTSINFKNSPYL
ncbi:hypothetical protein ACUZ9N_02215 [Mycoplasmopsis gallinarum]